MSDRETFEDAALGRTLAETAALNDPGRQAGLSAAAAVRRSSGKRTDRTAGRRGLLRALAWLALALVLFAGFAAVLEAIGL